MSCSRVDPALFKDFPIGDVVPADKLCEVDCVGGIHCFCASFAVIFHVSHA